MAGAPDSVVYLMEDNKTYPKSGSVAFLVLRPVSLLEADRWGIEHFKKLNINTYFLDLTYLLNDESAALKIVKSVDKPIEHDNLFKIRSYGELETVIKKLSQDTIFFDYILGASPITIKTAKLFRILKKYKAKYTFVSDGALPVPETRLQDNLFSTISICHLFNRVFEDPKKAFNFIINRIIRTLSRHRLFFPVPYIIFAGNSPVVECYCVDRSLNKNIIVPINSHDFSVYREYLDTFDQHPERVNATCVFLDEGLTHHSDFDILGIEPPNAKIYYCGMNALFSNIERQTGLKVVIAAHPRSRYENFPNPFNGRDIVKGKTIELVANCQLVVMHMSTAVSYAILFNKPIMTIKIPGLKQNSILNAQVETMAISVGSDVVDTDNCLLIPTPITQIINKNKQAEYKEKYLINKNAKNYSTWHIVASKIHEICAEEN